MRSSQLKSAFDDASLRHNEILNLEASIKELNDLYNDMNFLLHTQVKPLIFNINTIK